MIPTQAQVDVPGGRARAHLLDADDGFRLAGLGLLIVAAWVPWATSSWGGHEGQPRLSDLAMTRWILAALALMVLAATLIELTGRVSSETWPMVAVGASTVLAVVPLLNVVLIELVGIWLSPDRLPRTFRRLAVGANPMPGMWITAVAGGICLIGATGHGTSVVGAWRALFDGLRGRSESAIASGLLLVTVPLLAIARYASWFHVTSAAGDYSIPGWTVPWYGILSLFLTCATIATGYAAWFRPTTGAGVALATIGWVITVPAAVTMAITSSAPTLTAPPWIHDHLEELSGRASAFASSSPVARPLADLAPDLKVSLGTGGGAIATYVAGALVMLAGWLVCRAATRGTP